MSLGKCPVCGADVVKCKTGNYACVKALEDEDFHFFLFHDFKRFQDHIELDDAKVKTLLKGGTISHMLTSRKGDKYMADLELKIVEKGDKHYPNLVIVKE